MELSPAQISLRARMGAYRQHALHDPRQTTSKARATFLQRFEREVDPTDSLDPEERARRADQARRAYFTGLALKSSCKRAKRRSSDMSAQDPEASRRVRQTPGAPK
jgi:hypothetical protein